MSFNREVVLQKAKEIRANALKIINAANSGHPGGSLSCADILATLYFGGHMVYDITNVENSKRDILVMSKGHASPALYSCLALAGFFPIESTMSFRKLGSPFQGHIDRMKVRGVEMSTGSLGHGLSNVLGIALAAKLDQNPRKVFALLSDGELQEGSCWEAFMAAAHFKASNLIAIIDRNRIQLDGFTETTMALDPLSEKLRAFRWNVIEIDGHNVDEIDDALKRAYKLRSGDKPTVLLANTFKGKGVSFMEDQVKWHGVAPSKEDLDKALVELGF